MSDVSQIDGSVVRLRREAQGWAINDLAARACLSVKQIRQIEEGGLSSFYSENVKLTAAKKVASLLELSEAQLFGQVPLYEPAASEESHSHTEPFLTGSVDVAVPASVESMGVHLSRSEPLHFLAQPPEHESAVVSPDQDTSAPKEADKGLASGLPNHVPSEATAENPGTSGNYFLKILVLFLVAIAVAALLRPRTLETNPGAPEATTGQSMTSAGAPPPVEGAVPPEASSGSPAGALNGSVEVKPATLTEPSAAKTPASAAPATTGAAASTGSER